MESYHRKTDEELASLYHQRESAALPELMNRYLPLIQKIAFQYQPVLDFDDLVQEGCIGLLDAVRSFHRDKHTKFSTFAMVCIKNRMLKAVEKNNSKKVRFLTESLPLEDAESATNPVTPEQIFINRESLADVMEAVNTVLSPMERKILFSSLSGLDYQTIADSLNISPKSVDNALQRVRRKMKKSIHRP